MADITPTPEVKLLADACVVALPQAEFSLAKDGGQWAVSHVGAGIPIQFTFGATDKEAYENMSILLNKKSWLP